MEHSVNEKSIFAFLLSCIFMMLIPNFCFSETYTYDSLHRLTRVEYTDGTIAQYTYDDLGNRTSLVVTAESSSPTAAFSADQTNGYAPLTINFIDLSVGNVTSWAWNFGDTVDNTSTDQHPQHTYNTPGTYPVSLTVDGPDGPDTNTKPAHITVMTLPSEPVADFSATPVSGDAPLPVSFTDQSTGEITSWAWDFGNSDTSTEQNPQYTYNTSGTFPVTLTVTGPGGSDDEMKPDHIIVTDPDVITIQPGSEGKDTCYGTVYYQEGRPDSGVLSFGGWGDYYYDYLEFDLSQCPTAEEVTKAEIYIYAIIAPNDPNIEIMRITESWTESGVNYQNNPASVFYKNFGLVNAGWNSIDITDLYKDWLNGGYPNFGIKFSPTANNQTNSAFVSSDNEEESLHPKLVINQAESSSPTAAFSADQTNGYAPLTINFTDLSVGNITSWAWDFGDSGTSTGQHPQHTYNTPGTYPVSLTVDGPDGPDTNTKSAYITVNALPSAPVADFSATPVSGDAPLLVSFADQSTGEITSWVWDFGNGDTSSLQNPQYTYNTSGTFPVTLTVQGPGGSDDEIKPDHITVTDPGNNTPPTADAGTDQTVMEGDVVTLDGSGSTDTDGSIVGWHWTQTDGSAVSLSDELAEQPTFTAPEVDSNLSLTFDLEITDDDGDTDTDTVVIQINDDIGSGTVIFNDDFNDGVIDTEKWPTVSSNGVYENEGMLKTIRDVTDQGGDVTSKLIDISDQNAIVIERRVKIHYANEYYDGKLGFYIENAGDYTFGISYANYSYESGNECAKFGFFIFRNNANSHTDADQVDVSARIEPVWDEWFDEKIIYHPSSGILEYFINGIKQIEYNVGIIPTLSQYRFKLGINNWGWETGHYQYTDYFRISQEPYITATDSIYVVGYKNNGTDNDWWLKKFDENGNEDTINWNKTFDGGFGNDIAQSIAVDSGKNLYVVGYKNNGTDADWWLKKFDQAGNEDTTNWDKIFDYNGVGDAASVVSIDSDDNIYVGGWNGSNHGDWWLKKFDINGNEDTVNWDKTFDSGGTITSDFINDIAFDSNNNVYVVGKRADGNGDWWLKKFDPNGVEDTVNWNKDIAGQNWDYAFSAVFDPSDNIYIAGHSMDCWWLKKFDADGVEDTANWNKVIDINTSGNINSSNQPRSVAIDSNNDLYFAGYRSIGVEESNWWLKKFDANGFEDTVNWDKTIDGDTGLNYSTAEVANAVAIGSNNNVYIVGSKNNETDLDWWLKKFDENGNEDTANWNKTFGGAGNDFAACVAIISNTTSTVSWSDVSQTVTESAGAVTGIASLTATSSKDVIVPFIISGTATAGGVDHDLAEGSITIPAGAFSGSVTVNIIDDSKPETDETIILEMGTPINALPGSITTHTITITDNDVDTDGDGTPDWNDGCPTDANKIVSGTCGCGVSDVDSDQDGTPDCNDECPNDPTKTSPGICGCGTPDTDSDGDGTPDCNDECSANPDKIEPGVCGCGVSDVDSDEDGTPDCNDSCPLDPNKIVSGTCGCGIADIDSDQDGTPDCNDECPNDPNKTSPGVCGCGNPDTDSDGDGTPDCNDECSANPDKIEPGVCGCGIADTDTDEDGTPDCNDECPEDPDKIKPGACGCGNLETDTDGDGIADCIDTTPHGVDFGDAPDPSYPTLLATDGARHKIVPGYYLGSEVDLEPDGQPDITATGDDNDGEEDEDGVVFNTSIIAGQSSDIVITASASGMLDAWIDFNNNGDWDDAGEQIFASQALTIGDNNLDFMVPIDADAENPIFTRFRFSSTGGLSYTGFADDGEVEDYSISILADSDGDGEPDLTDLCPNDPNKIEAGICGCGVSDVDSDQDNTPDCIDECPSDSNKIDPGLCGCGIPDTDSDTDGLLYCNDNCPNIVNPDQTDTDKDGIGDVCDDISNIPGDINNDRSVDLKDLITSLKICSGIVNGNSVNPTADVDGDGKIGMPEVIFIFEKIISVESN